MTQFYFDRREGREKPVPDCAALGLTWCEDTQRCELPGTESLDGWDFGAMNGGMGLAPLAFAPAAAAAGPPGWLVLGVATIGTVLSRLFRIGGDDQKTSYQPPPNAGELFISFDDKYGKESVAYDMGPETQQLTAAKGNRWDDVRSYYSAFVSGSTHSGASSAARRVVEDVAKQHGVSISRAADLVLQAAGAVRKIWGDPMPGAPDPNASSTHLPPYCPAGTYHPFPIGHPRQDECVPFPDQNAGQQPPRTGQTQPRTGQQPGGGQRPRTLPPGFWLNPRTGMVEPYPQCPQGTVFDEYSGQCVNAGGSGFNLGSGSNWWLWLLLAAAALYATDSGGGDDRNRYYGGRRR